MIIVEHGAGTDPAANSYADLESLLFHGSYYGFPIPDRVDDQIDYLRRACAAMDRMQWKGRQTSTVQPLAWPRREIVIHGEFLRRTHIPYGIRHGQVMLAIEMYALDKGLTIREPTHGYDGKKLIPLSRSTPSVNLGPPLWAPSRTQFADYLVMRGLRIVK
ncbi:DnaT-like ssDNA-binding protein [Pseudomonas bohemica]|uniref:DnaT-like ssDNA-binding protein n=1 Tax=Pseudomonas bohemica TaxID=2044872 RepID=UPI000DA61CAF|nr:DnaT-like ssDNA-binding protein [Pseudomonas bohemica]